MYNMWRHDVTQESKHDERLQTMNMYVHTYTHIYMHMYVCPQSNQKTNVLMCTTLKLYLFYPFVFCLYILFLRERERKNYSQVVLFWHVLSLNIFGEKQKAEKSKTQKKAFDLKRMNGVGWWDITKIAFYIWLWNNSCIRVFAHISNS